MRGTTAKWYRQKGTGRARHGAQTAPQFRKGGVVFGPHPRSYEQAMPQKMRRKALCSVLSDKLMEGRIHIVEGFDFVAPRTKDMIAVLNALVVALSGHPWGITWGITLAGAKLTSALGVDLSRIDFWSDGFPADALAARCSPPGSRDAFTSAA